jgi:hypothetical protein
VNKSPFLSPGTTKAQHKMKYIIITKAAMDLRAMAGNNDKAPYGSIQKIPSHYSTYKLTWSQVKKRLEKLKKQHLLASHPRRSLH